MEQPVLQHRHVTGLPAGPARDNRRVSTGVSALMLSRHPTGALFVIATMTLALLFIGIHNAWDTVTYIVITAPVGKEENAQPQLPERVKP